MIKIIEYDDAYKQRTIDFILSILEDEFWFRGIERPDLLRIKDEYQQHDGNFLLAVDHGTVIGTIALCNYGQQRGYLKRMYVSKAYRGRGVAQQLLDQLLTFAKTKNYQEIYLATVSEMVAANKLYEKHGFERIEKLPNDFPVFNDTVFYKKRL